MSANLIATIGGMGGLAGSALFVSADFGEGAGGVDILASGTLASGALSAALGDSLGGSAALGGDFVSGALGSAALGSTALGGSVGFEDGAFSGSFVTGSSAHAERPVRARP